MSVSALQNARYNAQQVLSQMSANASRETIQQAQSAINTLLQTVPSQLEMQHQDEPGFVFVCRLPREIQWSASLPEQAKQITATANAIIGEIADVLGPVSSSSSSGQEGIPAMQQRVHSPVQARQGLHFSQIAIPVLNFLGRTALFATKLTTTFVIAAAPHAWNFTRQIPGFVVRTYRVGRRTIHSADQNLRIRAERAHRFDYGRQGAYYNTTDALCKSVYETFHGKMAPPPRDPKPPQSCAIM